MYTEPRTKLSKSLLGLLTCGLGGLQIVWSVVLSNGAPFLISLGLLKSWTPLVWLAAPLCGLFVQPVIGLHSDRCHSAWGRRRPFAAMGAIATVFALLSLSWVEELWHIFSRCLGSCSELPQLYERIITIVAAVLLIYCLNMAIATLQVTLRALVIEQCAPNEQMQASAWASYMTGIGNIVGYIAGWTSLPNLLQTKTLSQLQWLSILASVLLLATTGLTCLSVHVSHNENSPSLSQKKNTERTVILGLLSTWNSMPHKIKEICRVQFWSWMGWFPFLYYSTTYIGDLYSARIYHEAPRVDSFTQALIHQKAIHVGTFASLMAAIVSLSTNVLLHGVLGRYIGESRAATRGLNMSNLWTLSHILFAALMISTQFVQSSAIATVVVALAGVSWAVTVWAPFALIGSEIAALAENYISIEKEEPGEGHYEGPTNVASIMGIHNAAISAPQILAALVSSALFGFAQKVESEKRMEWVFLFCGGTSLVAAFMARGLDG